MRGVVEVTVTPMHADGSSTRTLEFDVDAELTVHDSMWKPDDADGQYCLCIRARRDDDPLRIENGILDIDPNDEEKLENDIGRDEQGRSPTVLVLLNS